MERLAGYPSVSPDLPAWVYAVAAFVLMVAPLAAVAWWRLFGGDENAGR